MNFVIDKDAMRIELSSLERILTFHKSQITEVSTYLLPPTWKEIRAPGTAIPGLTKAGTYYTSRGKEFWILKKNDRWASIVKGLRKSIVCSIDGEVTQGAPVVRGNRA